MSLKVWLPLDGSLENQGASAYQAVGTDLTVDNSGKVGKCYSFNGTSSKIVIANFSIGNNWSYGAWVYSPTSSRGWEGIIILNNNGGDADMQLGFYTYPTGNRIQNTANGQYNSTISMTYGQWNHLFATFDGSNLKTYINGVLVNTKTITNSQLVRANLTIGARCRGSSYDCFFSGKINDVRIYDHCLSAAEVREISQGLILHYKLDDMSRGIQDSSGYNHNGTIIGTATLTSSPRYSFGIAMNNTSTANRIDAISLPSEVQTISLWVKGNKATSQVYFADKNSGLEFGTYSSLGVTNLTSKPLYNLDNFITNEWNHIVVIKDSTNNKLYVNGIAATTSSSNDYYTHNGGLYLFNRNVNNNYACNGAISDFRAYVTTLDADAIHQLYEVGAKIDNKQNLHTFELIENQSSIKVTKRGQVKCDDLTEATTTKFYKSKDINTNNLIEL